MTDQEKEKTNRILHEFMGYCDRYDWDILTDPCPLCGGLDPDDEKHLPFPDYCSSLDLMRTVEEKVIYQSVDAFDIYATALMQEIADEHSLAISISTKATFGNHFWRNKHEHLLLVRHP